MPCDDDRSAFYIFQLISKASKDTGNAGLRVLDLACGKGGDLGKWAAHPDGVEKYVGSDIAFGSLEHLVERMASESHPCCLTVERCPGVVSSFRCVVQYFAKSQRLRTKCATTHTSAESAEKGGRFNWGKVPVKLFEADLGRNDVQVRNA